MSELVKGKKVVNAIGIGIMAFLGSGTSLLQVSAAAVETEAMETASETSENTQETSQNQETIDALDIADGAIKARRPPLPARNLYWEKPLSIFRAA